MSDVRQAILHTVIVLAAFAAVTFMVANGNLSGEAATAVITFGLGGTTAAAGVTAGTRAAKSAADAATEIASGPALSPTASGPMETA